MRLPRGELLALASGRVFFLVVRHLLVRRLRLAAAFTWQSTWKTLLDQLAESLSCVSTWRLGLVVFRSARHIGLQPRREPSPHARHCPCHRESAGRRCQAITGPC